MLIENTLYGEVDKVKIAIKNYSYTNRQKVTMLPLVAARIAVLFLIYASVQALNLTLITILRQLTRQNLYVSSVSNIQKWKSIGQNFPCGN